MTARNRYAAAKLAFEAEVAEAEAARRIADDEQQQVMDLNM
jgi:hypothetical protein